MWLFVAFLAVPLIEIALFIQVGGLIGLWPTLGIVVLTALIGTMLVRSQGAMAMNDIRKSFNNLSDPTEPLAHGAMILLAGALLLTPGFFTDAVGFALCTPGVRKAAMRYASRHVKMRRFEMGGAPHGDPRRPGGHGTAGRPRQGDVIETEYEEVTPPERKRPTHQGSGWTKH
ncbi:exlusion protein FxsA [Roseivivax halodurans JCM 10272]|uniref:Exlusion protein FxsA n=1 Tax=Roseivivax halodurans JCM 10272 TaxID=1449350 RepID=X7EL86_9RHOB|nr:FxsA family protein [Roseivivax halodurans]ETX15911.1 exlusion protein FxsA [Roseivivax halodurans JCM 10272]